MYQETFEFLNLLQTHGFPKVLGVLTHLDTFKSVARMNKVKKKLKTRFWNEVRALRVAVGVQGLT